MKITSQARETRKCSALIGGDNPRRTSRRRARCGVTALDFGDVRVAGDLVTIPLCQAHFRVLRDSADPRGLALAWSLETLFETPLANRRG